MALTELAKRMVGYHYYTDTFKTRCQNLAQKQMELFLLDENAIANLRSLTGKKDDEIVQYFQRTNSSENEKPKGFDLLTEGIGNRTNDRRLKFFTWRSPEARKEKQAAIIRNRINYYTNALSVILSRMENKELMQNGQEVKEKLDKLTKDSTQENTNIKDYANAFVSYKEAKGKVEKFPDKMLSRFDRGNKDDFLNFTNNYEAVLREKTLPVRDKFRNNMKQIHYSLQQYLTNRDDKNPFLLYLKVQYIKEHYNDFALSHILEKYGEINKLDDEKILPILNEIDCWDLITDALFANSSKYIGPFLNTLLANRNSIYGINLNKLMQSICPEQWNYFISNFVNEAGYFDFKSVINAFKVFGEPHFEESFAYLCKTIVLTEFSHHIDKLSELFEKIAQFLTTDKKNKPSFVGGYELSTFINSLLSFYIYKPPLEKTSSTTLTVKRGILKQVSPEPTVNKKVLEVFCTDYQDTFNYFIKKFQNENDDDINLEAAGAAFEEILPSDVMGQNDINFVTFMTQISFILQESKANKNRLENHESKVKNEKTNYRRE